MTTTTSHKNVLTEFHHHYIHIDHKKLHYVTLGEGPAVLLISG